MTILSGYNSSVVTILYVCIIIKQSHVHANKDFSISVYINIWWNENKK